MKLKYAAILCFLLCIMSFCSGLVSVSGGLLRIVYFVITFVEIILLFLLLNRMDCDSPNSKI
jgi:hypothetical protein